ncbi:MAG: hypothetical protein WCH84_00360 [Verrucomicrobiota bacterium]
MMRIKSGIIVGISLMAACLPLLAQTNKPATPAGGLPESESAMYSLDQFGPVSTAAEAEATFQKASTDLIAAGGGILVIPAKTLPGWIPKNTTQHELRTPAAPAQTKSWRTGPGVTVIDARGSTTKIMPPQTGGMVFQRTLDLPPSESLPHWGYYPLVSMKNTILRGSTSYHDWLQEDVKAGKDQRFYVATIRGIFPGEFVNGLQYNGGVPRLCVKSLGYDKEKKMWYFVADTDVDVVKSALISNKNHANVLNMDTYSHTENQTFDVKMWRYNYSQGDNYLFDARFKYMGDVHSTAGDENGVLYAAFVEALTQIFRGTVEQWNPATSELIFKAGASGSTLGTGRPVINMNPTKWITKGTVNIVQPANWIEDSSKMDNAVFQGKTYPTTIEKNKLGIPVLKMGGLIRFSADAPVTDEAVGRYFAVDEKDECVPNTDVRRWYLIDSVTQNPDGTKDIKIIRHWWGAKAMSSPMLYKPENCSSDGHVKPLQYIIAPGANAYDVADGVNSPKRIIRLAPTPFTGTALDFAAGDAIEQAIGSDPFKPTPFRSWMWDQIPGAFPSSVFDIANNGAIMRDSLIWVHGNSTGNIEKDKGYHYDRNPTWDKFLRLDSTCNIGIRFGADTADAAILFTQPHHEQPLKWYYDITTNRPPQVASLTVSRDTGDFNFVGGNLNVNGSVGARGLSADGKIPARNLRGKDVAVKAGETRVTIAFPAEEADASYAVFIEKNWLGDRAIAKKDAKGFTIQFEKPAPADAKLDWMIVR